MTNKIHNYGCDAPTAGGQTVNLFNHQLGSTPSTPTKRKLGEYRACEVCGKEKYYQRTTLKKRGKNGCRTCSRKCSAILRHREKRMPQYSANFKKKYTKKYSKKNMIGYRAEALMYYGDACMICGYNEKVKLLDVHHIDGNRQNNKIKNLEVLCVMCHAKKTRGLM